MKTLKCLIIALAINSCGQVMAQNGLVSFVNKIGAALDTMAVSGIDHNYIEVPERPWQAIMRGNISQTILSLKMEANEMGSYYTARPYFKTVPSQYVGLWVGYRGYGIGYTVNVGGDKGNLFTIGATGGSYGINLRIHTFENSDPDFFLDSDLIPADTKGTWFNVHLHNPIRVKTVFLDGYYMFNGKKFSYAAAYDQSVIQKRSAGSLMVGLMYNYTKIDYANNLNGDLIYLMGGLGKLKLWQGSIGVGYAYNWVPVKGLLVNVLAMPMLTVVNKLKVSGYTTNVEELLDDPYSQDPTITEEQWDTWFYDKLRVNHYTDKSKNSSISIGFDGRASVTYNFGRCFLNAYGQFNNIRYSEEGISGYVNDWYVNTSFGVRL